MKVLGLISPCYNPNSATKSGENQTFLRVGSLLLFIGPDWASWGFRGPSWAFRRSAQKPNADRYFMILCVQHVWWEPYLLVSESDWGHPYMFWKDLE
jgi:hypothetical protein